MKKKPARGRHACLPRARFFFISPIYFLAPATQANKACRAKLLTIATNVLLSFGSVFHICLAHFTLSEKLMIGHFKGGMFHFSTLRPPNAPSRLFNIIPVYDVSIKLSMLFHHLFVLLFCSVISLILGANFSSFSAGREGPK